MFISAERIERLKQSTKVGDKYILTLPIGVQGEYTVARIYDQGLEFSQDGKLVLATSWKGFAKKLDQ